MVHTAEHYIQCYIRAKKLIIVSRIGKHLEIAIIKAPVCCIAQKNAVLQP